MTSRSSLRAAAVGVVIGVFGCGCGGGGTPETSTPARVAPPMADPPWEVRALFGFGEQGIDAVDGEEDHFIADGMRVALEGDEVRFAADHSFDPFTCSAHLEDGYVFLTRDGALYTASEFMGPLTAHGAPGQSAMSCLISRGVMVAKLGGNDLLFVGSDGDSWHLPEAMRGNVVDAAFRGPRSGIVIVSPGVALLTRDNVTYAPIDLGGRTAVSTWPEAERWLVLTSDGWFSVSDAGVPTLLDAAPVRTRREVPDEVFERIDRAARARQPVAFSDSLPGPDGRVLVYLDPDYVEDENALPLLETWSPTTGLRSVHRPGEGCEIRAWGGRALANCPDALLVQERTGWRHLTESNGGRVVLSRDGSTLATLDDCDPERGDADAGTCGRTLRVHDGERWRSRTLDARVALLDVHGSHALVQEERGRAVRVVSVESAADDRTLTMPAPFATLFVRFDAGGGIFGSAWGQMRDGVTPTIAVYGPPNEPLAEVTLPADAFGFEMADARHGMAVGDSLDEVWVTTDGARTWQPLVLPVAGDASEVELPVNARGGSSPVLQCSAVACRVHYAWLWGAPAATAGLDPAGRLVIAPEPAEAAALTWTPPAPTGPSRAVECNVPASGDGEGSDRAQRSTGSLTVRGDQLRWAFHENGRTFEAVSADLSSAPISTDELVNGVLEPLLVTPRFALFDHCTQPMDSDEPDPDYECSLRQVRSNAEPAPFLVPIPDLRDDDVTSLLATYPLPRGRTANHVGVSRGDHRIRDVVVELDADGDVVRSRLFVVPRFGHVGWLAVRGSTPGLLLGGPGRSELRFHGIDGSAAVSVALPGEAPVRLCPRSGAGVSVVATDASFGPRLHTGTDEPYAYVPVVRLAGEASCLLGYQPRPTWSFSDYPSVIASRWLGFDVARGVLRARSVQPGTGASEPVACSPPAAD